MLYQIQIILEYEDCKLSCNKEINYNDVMETKTN